MRVSSDQFGKHFRSGVKSCYLIAGNEPLIALEACDALRAFARESGATDRLVFDVGSGFDWDAWRVDVRSLGLFAQTRLIEVRFPNLKITQGAAESIAEFARDPGMDILLVTLPEWNKSLERQDWVQAIDTGGVVVSISTMSRDDFVPWLRQRAGKHKVQLTSDAFEELNARAEGNLLAADQELAKLALLAPDQTIDAVTLVDLVADHARYDVQALWEAVLRGDAERVRHILHALRGEGEEAAGLLGYPMWQAQTLLLAAQQRGNLSSFWPTRGVFGSRVALYQRALDRPWARLFREARVVDAASKGREAGDPWVLLERWLLRATSIKLVERFAA